MSRIDDGILSQADNTAHFLGLEHALKNVEEFLKRCPFLLNVLGGIVQDIFGEIGLPEYESEEDFTSKRRKKLSNEILQKHITANFNQKIDF